MILAVLSSCDGAVTQNCDVSSKVCPFTCYDCQDKEIANNIISDLNLIDPTTLHVCNASLAVENLRSTAQMVLSMNTGLIVAKCYQGSDFCNIYCENCQDKKLCATLTNHFDTLPNIAEFPYSLRQLITSLQDQCSAIQSKTINGDSYNSGSRVSSFSAIIIIALGTLLSCIDHM